MKIIIPGGSGQIGTFLAQHLHEQGHEVVVLSRNLHDTPWRTRLWDGQTLGVWKYEIDGADVVINLAGRSVNCRYHARNRAEILNSRIDSTHVVGKAIANASNPPATWLQMSTATIYAHRFDAPNDEATGILSSPTDDVPDTWRFSFDVASSWENAAYENPTPHTRKVLLRSAMVMDPARGGVFDTLLKLVRFGLGGQSGNGKQFMSWIHHADFVRAIDWLIAHPKIEGPVNLAAPNPLPNADFMSNLRTHWGVKFGLPATAWMIEIGTLLLRSESELILKSRRVTPGVLSNSGFEFQFEDWGAASAELCAAWRTLNLR